MGHWEALTREWNEMQVRFSPAWASCEERVRLVLVIVLHQGRFLLAAIPERGWCIPSGHIEPNETAEEAARREVYEETGAHIENLRLIGCYELRPKRDYAPVFIADLKELTPIPPGSESRGLRWATLEELPALYYQWDALLEAVFQYALEKWSEEHHRI